MPLDNNFTSTIIESWFIPFDILMIICTTFAVVLALIFVFLIIVDKTCHTVPMMLVANSCLAELVFGCDMLFMDLFTLQNDLRQIQYEDSLGVFRGFLGYVVTGLQNYSYLLQSIYRYITVVYPTRLFFQSARFEASVICLTWIFSFICPLPYLLTSVIRYNSDNQICQAPFRFSLLSIITSICKRISKHVTPVNTLLRAERELKMVRQIVILVGGITTIGFLYTAFAVISFFTIPPKYHFRLAYIFVDISLVFVMVAIFEIYRTT